MRILISYISPDITLPVTSFLVGVLACLLVFSRSIFDRCRRIYRFLRRAPLPDQVSEPAAAGDESQPRQV
jgi:hypothetical protein